MFVTSFHVQLYFFLIISVFILTKKPFQEFTAAGAGAAAGAAAAAEAGVSKRSCSNYISQIVTNLKLRKGNICFVNQF